ncbi:HAD-IIB family hydrolase [Paenibacillus sp. 1001270B_150601_E10]|uniref:HAD-IIB family hydrolase n=1 Tax=Paenibacillus sp. 1001270B_150601_E10 TaxID=2787079 RepID=UPI00189C6AF9|nr:HAD family hydrolase [Paenibacillus sp. 1001270B_150601_E10]
MKFVFDLDGTICFKGNPVSATIMHTLAGLTAAGHDVIFASARPIRDLLPVIDKAFHSYPMIGGNGSIVAKDGTIYSTVHFSDEERIQLLAYIASFNATYLADGTWNYAYTGPDDHPILRNLDPEQRANKVVIDDLHPLMKLLILTASNMELLEEKLHSLNVVIHSHGKEGVIDISPAGIHKWSGLQQLGVEEKSYIAFGNDANDISMFQHAKHAVMIGHHDKLAPYASEAIAMDGDLEAVEENIVQKLLHLAKVYHYQYNEA